MEKEIKAFLAGRVKSGDFKKEYSVPIDAVVASVFPEPLSEEEKAVFRAIGEALTREHVRQLVYPAWARKQLISVLNLAKAKLAEKNYAETREAIWAIGKVGVEEVDSLSRKYGNMFLNKNVNPAQWKTMEKSIQGRCDELLSAKKFTEARKFVEEFAGIRTFSTDLKTAPAPTSEEKEDSLRIVEGRFEGGLGTLAVNARLAKLKEQLLAAIATARKSDLDARMQKLIDDLTAKVVALVEAGEYDEARNTIRDVTLVNDSEWDAKIYAARIGLMNSIVNPNQLAYLETEAEKTIDGLVEEKKFAEAFKFIDEYPYVHDTFAQIKKSFALIEKAMKGLKLDDDKSAEYAASRLLTVRGLMEKRLGRYVGKEDYSELEKALGELEKGYVAQHYDNVAATNVTKAIKGEIVEMINEKYAPLTTWEMNEELRRFLASKRPEMPVDTTENEDGQNAAAAVEKPVMRKISTEVDYDAQIAMAEAAIAEPADVYGLAAVLGDYARIMRRCKAGNVVNPEEAVTMLIASVFLNQPEIFKTALSLKADVNSAARRDGVVRPPILLAVQLGRIEFIKLLQVAKCRYDVVDVKGDTLMHYAAERGNLALVKAVAPVVKVDSVNKAGETALFVAVRRNQLAVLKALLQLAGNAEAQKKFVTMANTAGDTAFEVACKTNGHMLLDAMVAAGAEYDERHLGLAFVSDCVGVAQWMVEKGLDVNAEVVHKSVHKYYDPTKPVSATYAYLKAEGLRLGMVENAPNAGAAKGAEVKKDAKKK